MIKKYYVSNFIETSIWKIFDDKKQLRIAGSTMPATLSTIIEFNNFSELPTCEFAVNDTTKLLKMLNALDEEVKFEMQKDNRGKIYNISLNSSNVEMEYVTADIDVLRANKIVQTYPKDRIPDEFDVEIVLDKDFVDTYIASTTALVDSESVVFRMNKDNKVELLFGYIQGANKALNTSKIKYVPKTANGKDVLSTTMAFNAEYLKQIFVVNKDAGDTTLKLGVAKSRKPGENELIVVQIQYVTGDITATYYLTGMRVN